MTEPIYLCPYCRVATERREGNEAVCPRCRLTLTIIRLKRGKRL